MTSTLIQVIAPATTANLGPGYDCLGLALDLWNRLEVNSLPVTGSKENLGDTPRVEIVGEGSEELETTEENLVYRAMEFLFREADQEMPPVRLKCYNDIPLARGLGSSAAAIAGGLVAANAICSQDFSGNDLLEMAASIEGHPDNVAAAVLGAAAKTRALAEGHIVSPGAPAWLSSDLIRGGPGSSVKGNCLNSSSNRIVNPAELQWMQL